MKNFILKTIAVVLALATQVSIFACTVSITNDISNPIQVVEKEGKYAVMIMPGKTKEIGSKAFHANFYLYEMMNDEWVLRYTVDQASCNLEKHQDITVTDVINNTGNVEEFFTVIQAGAAENIKPCCQH
jgi:hypothetical protein